MTDARQDVRITSRLLASIPQDRLEAMLDNGRRSALGEDVDPVPSVRFFAPDGRGCWLLTEIDPEDGDTAYGLCDLGIGMPECGAVSLTWLSEQTGPASMHVERDISFPRKDTPALSYLDRAASAAGRIVI